MRAHAGVVSVPRGAGYFGVAALAAVAVGAGLTAAFGLHRIMTAIVIAVFVFVAAAFALFRSDRVTLDESRIDIRLPWGSTALPWDRVVAARLSNMADGRWGLALDLTAGDERHNELALLAIPPVTREVGNAYEMRKREQLTGTLDLLRHKRVPMTVLPDIRAALADFWRIDLPVG